MNVPFKFYTHTTNLTGIALHQPKQFLFVADKDGFVRRGSLQVPHQHVNDTAVIIDPQMGVNFLPLLLSIDWLNDHLYILGEVNSPTRWQISRCQLDGSGMTVAVAGLYQRPLYMEVDPFNGYLYWVITGRSAESGLYRLDLGDISNGVKHTEKPFHIPLNSNPGGFVIEHRLSKVFVALQDNNTVVSVSFDG